MPKARVWYGSRVVHSAAAQTYTAVPLPYEITYEMDQFHLDDDLYGAYFRWIPDMVRQTRRWMSYELRDLLENGGAYTGTAQNGFDGLSNFDTAHPVDIYNSGAGTYSNDFSGGGANVSYTKANGGTVNVLTGGAFGVTAFKTLYEYMMTFKGEDGERLGIRPTMLMHPVNLKTEVEVVLKNSSFAPPAWGNITSQVGAADNAFRRFGVTPHMNEFLNDPQMWYLADTSRSFKPLGWGMRKAWQIVPRFAPTDPNVYDRHAMQLGGNARGMPFWTYSFLMARSGP
jgi:phage major head subunit gpT-like protein